MGPPLPRIPESGSASDQLVTFYKRFVRAKVARMAHDFRIDDSSVRRLFDPPLIVALPATGQSQVAELCVSLPLHTQNLS